MPKYFRFKNDVQIIFSIFFHMHGKKKKNYYFPNYFLGFVLQKPITLIKKFCFYQNSGKQNRALNYLT